MEDETKEYCRDCERRKSNYEQGRSLWVHIPPVSNSVYRLKYHNKRYYAEIFGKELADEFEFQIRRWGIQAIIPIPLHRSKMRKRGYNQAELLAKQLSECMRIPMEKDILYRIKKIPAFKGNERGAETQKSEGGICGFKIVESTPEHSSD